MSTWLIQRVMVDSKLWTINDIAAAMPAAAARAAAPRKCRPVACLNWLAAKTIQAGAAGIRPSTLPAREKPAGASQVTPRVSARAAA